MYGIKAALWPLRALVVLELLRYSRPAMASNAVSLSHADMKSYTYAAQGSS